MKDLSNEKWLLEYYVAVTRRARSTDRMVARQAESNLLHRQLHRNLISQQTLYDVSYSGFTVLAGRIGIVHRRLEKPTRGSTVA